MSILQAQHVSYTYQSRYQRVEAVRDVSCSFYAGKMAAIVGHSGSGKTTLLSLLAGLDLPTDGVILVDGQSTASIDRDKYRRDTVSMVHQSFNLFPLLTALENVMYPMELLGVSRITAAVKAKQFIDEVGLESRIYKQRPQMMSGGEQQRIAIARALASGGRILLADEPTGNLDTENGRNIIEILSSLARERKYAVIVVTHDLDVAGRADIKYVMRDGCLSIEEGE